MIYTETIRITVDSQGFSDITGKVEDIVRKSKVKRGICVLFSKGSTSGLILNENEPMLFKDIINTMENISSSEKLYEHSENGFSHIRSLIIGSSQTIPVDDGKMVRGTWQDILAVNFDIRSREREVVVTVLGE